ncbi:hypothetical protein DVS28_b0020 (plasmid) [Euzebya pacifica]|uniref:Uncharacterized protein n=2 Tax=Euzebya pacifica TaxID=1608957 RepID=A0A346Y5P3_9ACTN|nr:hypothetical protein DVS28_b0020 [Euzebya pacifica]
MPGMPNSPLRLVLVTLDNDRFTIVRHDEFHGRHDDNDDDLDYDLDDVDDDDLDGGLEGPEWTYVPGTEDGIEDHLPDDVVALMQVTGGLMGPDQVWWPTSCLEEVRAALLTAGHPLSTANW